MHPTTARIWLVADSSLRAATPTHCARTAAVPWCSCASDGRCGPAGASCLLRAKGPRRAEIPGALRARHRHVRSSCGGLHPATAVIRLRGIRNHGRVQLAPRSRPGHGSGTLAYRHALALRHNAECGDTQQVWAAGTQPPVQTGTAATVGPGVC